jgi:glutamate synthase (NADPH/NADH) small chain
MDCEAPHDTAILPAQRPWNPKYAWSMIPRAAPPKRSAAERIADFSEIYGNYDEESVRMQASRCIQCPKPPCVQGCPLNNHIPEWIALAAQGRFLEAAALSRCTSNLPEVCSRVCPQERLCEGACVLNARTEPVAIGAIERFINDTAFEHGDVGAVPAQPIGLSVAVIGSGPGGLACADELARLGYDVTVFEAEFTLGGLLVNGIPAFKLAKDIVERRIALLRRLGVRFVMGARVGWNVSLKQLRRSYDAVFLGIGAQKPKPLGIPGSDLPGVVSALPFLIQKNVNPPGMAFPSVSVEGRRVAVLGGGDSAMDCLRTALRCGAREAVCLYRRDFANMPGSRKEYANAIEEGARFEFLANPVAIRPGPGGSAAGVDCVRMELGEPDASGRRRPRPVPGSEFTVPAELVIAAYGFDPAPFPADSEFAAIRTEEWGGLTVDADQMTSMPGVFAGGDSVRGPSLVAHAVRDARRAARGIHRYLAPRREALRAVSKSDALIATGA